MNVNLIAAVDREIEQLQQLRARLVDTMLISTNMCCEKARGTGKTVCPDCADTAPDATLLQPCELPHSVGLWLDESGRKYRLAALPEALTPNSVRLPTTADEAALMVLTGTAWLKYNAPERLKQPAQERTAPVQGYTAGIPWSLHLEAYDAYKKKWGFGQPALIEDGCRGGFYVSELDELVPGWRDKVSEIARLKAEVAALRAAMKDTK